MEDIYKGMKRNVGNFLGAGKSQGQEESLRNLNVLALYNMSCSSGKVPNPNYRKICPFPFPSLGEVLATCKRRWEIDAEDTGLELLWRGAGVAQADSWAAHVFMGRRNKPSKNSQV